MGVDQVGAFFGGKPIADSDESAARTLALAFAAENGGGGGIAGTPARVATKELSLDSVFSPQAAPATPSSFSFDQFFSKNAASESAPSAAAQSGADSPDDVAQFTSWLQGLKRK